MDAVADTPLSNENSPVDMTAIVIIGMPVIPPVETTEITESPEITARPIHGMPVSRL
nr:hypothetical protein [uncultured Arsenicibacter sp.]